MTLPLDKAGKGALQNAVYRITHSLLQVY